MRDLKARTRSRAAHPLPRPSRRADVAAEPRRPSTRSSTSRSPRRTPAASASPCSISTSTASRKSTTSTDTRPATRCCRPWPRASRPCSTNGQMMARLGGDEFAILAPEHRQSGRGRRARRDHPGGACDRTRATATSTRSQTSIGIAIYPDDATDRETLLSQADTALYRAKTEGRNTYRFFEAAMGAEVRDRRQLEHDLRQAIARDEFRLVYQPQGDIATGHDGRLRGAAALAASGARARPADRLHSDRRGLRRHPADRRMGAAHRVPRGRVLDRSR